MSITPPSAESVIALTATDFPGAVVDSIIADAILMVEDCISSMTEARQTAIVKYVAAHLIVSTNGASGSGAGTVTSMKLGDASETYAKSALSGEGLSSTHFGQQALMLDPSGCLRGLGKSNLKMVLL